MAKIKYSSLQETIETTVGNAKERGLVHLHTTVNTLTGRKFNLKETGKELLNFGTLGYLALEKDPRLIEATIEAVRTYGTQFSASRAYVSLGINEQLEDLLEKIFGNPVLFTLSSSIGHIAVLPTIVQNDEAVILDQQVHASVQTAAQLLKPKGIPVEIIRHNNLNMLEEKIKEWSNKYSKIWYCIDSVYSMYGDFAPLQELESLLNKYPQLYLYADDAHGISWAGKNGRGFALSKIDLHARMVLTSTLGKAFGVGGGIFVFPNNELRRKVLLCGGPLTFSVPTTPPMVAACIASAKIHLSDEIYTFQKELSDRVSYCNAVLNKYQIPQKEESTSPIFFVPVGTPVTGYNLVDRMMKEGLFVNLAVFPAVAVKNTGLRFCISRHNHFSDIDLLGEALNYHYPKALLDEGKTINDIKKAFNLSFDNSKVEDYNRKHQELRVEIHTSIKFIDQKVWDDLLGNRGAFDWKALNYYENIYSGNAKPEDNWSFYYFLIKNNENKVVVATFYTTALWKEDMLAPSSVSYEIEQKRKENPYHLTTRIIGMGTLFSVGNHLFIDKTNPQWKNGIKELFEKVNEIMLQEQINIQILRDFTDEDQELQNYLLEQGFFKVNMPENNIVFIPDPELDLSCFLKSLQHEDRYYIKKKAVNYEIFYDVEIVSNPSASLAHDIYELYKNVASKSYELNIFEIPLKFFNSIINNDQWEIIVLKIKKEYLHKEVDSLVGFSLNYKGKDAYCFMLTGIEYNFLKNYHVYAQILWQIIKRAHHLKYKKVVLGLTATQNKRKFGALTYKQSAYVQAKDNFTMEQINQMNVEAI